MGRKLVNGTVPYIGATFGTATNITGISNAASAVFSFAAGHGITVGDYFEVPSCGWPQLAGRVFRASAVSTNDITVAGLNTTSTTDYPAGQGTGSGRRIITWAAIQQVNADGLSVSGGEQQFLTGQYIDSSLEFRVPTNKSAIDVSMLVDDDQTLGYWTTVRAAETAGAAGTSYPLKLTYPGGGGNAVGSGIWTVSAAPAMQGNNVQKRTIGVAMAGVFTEYTT